MNERREQVLPNAGDPAVYLDGVRRQLPRLLGLLDREPGSRTFGSFDREHWSWKFRDFPVTMLQYALLPLARIWSGAIEIAPYSANERLAGWLGGAIESTLDRQHRRGAFDSVAPFSQDHGVTLAMAYVLGESAGALGNALRPSLRVRLDDALVRAGDFALSSEEDYAFISNHQALFALAYRVLFERCGQRRFEAASRRIVDAICAHQSPDGWYEEYGGPDPGYETLGLHYLALLWQRTGDADLLRSLERSAEFLAWCVHPDGSLGGVYGSRHTQLYYPAGLEILSPRVPRAAGIARFFRSRLAAGNVVTPDSVDAQNLPTLLASYVEAARVGARSGGSGGAEWCRPEPVPCEAWDGKAAVQDFPDAAIRIISREHYYGVIHGGRGGVCRFFSRPAGDLVYEDAGWLARHRDERWTSQRLGFGAFEDDPSPDRAVCRTRFARVRQQVPTPASFMALRMLNLTLFRSLALGSWLRRWIIERLITSAREAPLGLVRSFEMDEEGLVVRDDLALEGNVQLEGLGPVRAYTSVHMGSAKYFHPAELAEPNVTLATDPATLLKALLARGEARSELRIDVVAAGRTEEEGR